MNAVFICTLSMVVLSFTPRCTECQVQEGPRMKDLRVECSREAMLVTVDFHQPFTGIIFSRGYYGIPECNFVNPSQTGSTTATFSVPLRGCGTVSQMTEGRGQDIYLENTLVIQGDPDIQEAWDVARKIRCLWRHTFARTVTAKPFQVFEPAPSASPLHRSDKVKAVMEVQQGRGPFSKPSSGYLHLGEESSLVVYVQDPTRRMDARMVDCRAVGSSRSGRDVVANVPLIDERGCPVRPGLISPVYKTRDTGNSGADLIMYTNFRAFKLPDSAKFNIRCQMQVCERSCPNHCTKRNLTRIRREDPPPGPFRELERQVEVLSQDHTEDHYRQVCLWESSWITMTGALTAGYLFLLLVVWVLFWRMRTYRRLLFQCKMAPLIVR